MAPRLRHSLVPPPSLSARSGLELYCRGYATARFSATHLRRSFLQGTPVDACLTKQPPCVGKFSWGPTAIFLLPAPSRERTFVRNMSSSASKARGEKTATETYQKLTQLEHVLKRPDTYIGSVEHNTGPMWILDEDANLKWREVSIVPGLYKIFDEIIVNAADNKVRDPAMKLIRVNVDPEEKSISVFNDGKGIPIEMHEKEKMYVPELIFGNLLTSSNYDDKEQKVTGGRNGFGAKLCNIFSDEFVLETADEKQIYSQKWTNNMGHVEKPILSRNAKRKSYTKITFKPDLTKFGMTEFEPDLLGVIKRRVYDMAGTVRGISVFLNDQVVPIKDFKGYTNLFAAALTEENAEPAKIISMTSTPAEEHRAVSAAEKADWKPRWEVGFSLSDGSGFQQMSFVNSIATTSGGTHVEYITDQIAKFVIENMAKKGASGKLTKAQIKNNIFVFVNCKIQNPSFSSQTKELLTSKLSQFGSRCELPQKFLKNVLGMAGLTQRLLSISENNAARELKRHDGGRNTRLTQYTKLTDAQKAGTRESSKCTLILTEGDSALAQAKLGLQEVGYEYYGCFPLRGKMLNVRDASYDQVMKNKEIKALKQIIGLQHKKRYDSVQGLRYGHVMMMTDQDHDGSHIKGLLINFFESSFPGLLDIPGFLQEFITPVGKVTIESGPRKGEVIPFYNMPEYENWREEQGTQISKWSFKYFKGLGTSLPVDMRGYFADIRTHERTFRELQGRDKDRIELVFSKVKTEERKQWLQDFRPGTFLDPSLQIIPIESFIDEELILFSMADNIRSIPSVVDGLKPSQRKIMWVSFSTIVRKEMKVQSLSGSITEKASYHHGPESLTQAIIGLAQQFVGANNLNWLLPLGGFGSRDTGGKDASAPRYISTRMNPITMDTFRKDDAPLLHYLKEDAASIEPEYYVPILPTLLVNGAEGIGTGWSTNIPSYNPTDLVENLKRMMNGEALKPMTPWYRGWTGDIEKVPNSDNQWRVCGRIEEIDDTTLAITELPVKMWTDTMKKFLNESTKGNHRSEGVGDKEKEKMAAGEFIEDMYEEHTDKVRFIVKLSPDEMRKAKQVGLYKKFKLLASISTSNLVAFDPQGRLRRYETPEDIIKEFYHVRLDFYKKRRDNLIDEMKNVLELLSSRARFIKMIVERELGISNKKKKVLEKELNDLRFPLFINTSGKPYWPGELNDSVKKEIENKDDEDEDEDEDEEDSDALVVEKKKLPSYNYLLNMPISSLTLERYRRLLKERGETEEALSRLLETDIKDMWTEELDAFLVSWEQFLVEDEKERTASSRSQSKGQAKPSKRKRRNGDDDDDDFGTKKPKRKRQTKPVIDYNAGHVVPPPPIEDAAPKPKPPPRGLKSSSKESSVRVKSEEPSDSQPSQVDSQSQTQNSEPSAAEELSGGAAGNANPRAKSTSNSKVKEEAASVQDADAMEIDQPAAPPPREKRSRKTASSITVDDATSDDGENGEPEDSFVLSD